jgi:hypothetical protein
MSSHDLSNYPLKIGAGSAAAPALYLSTYTTTGLYSPAANQLGWAISGTQRALLSSSGLDVSGTRLQVTNSGAGGQINCYTYRDSTSLSSLQLFAARGSSASPACVQTDDAIGTVAARPWQTGTTFNTSGLLRFVAAEAHSATATGTKCQVYICANGDTAVALGLEIGQDKTIAIPGPIAHQGSSLGFFNTSPAAKPTITGSRGGNAALASLLTGGAALGLWTNSTTA